MGLQRFAGGGGGLLRGAGTRRAECAEWRGAWAGWRAASLLTPWPACAGCLQVLACDIDLLHPPLELEKQKHKLKRLVESPNSYFMDVKCQGCFTM